MLLFPDPFLDQAETFTADENLGGGNPVPTGPLHAHAPRFDKALGREKDRKNSRDGKLQSRPDLGRAARRRPATVEPGAVKLYNLAKYRHNVTAVD